MFNSWLCTSALLPYPSVLFQIHRIWDRESKLLHRSDLTIQPHWVNWGIPAPSHIVPEANRASGTCRAKAAAQLSSELSRSPSEQAAQQAAEQAGLDFPLYCNHIYFKRNSLQQTPLFRKGSLWVEGSQEPTSSILRVVSGEKECNQDITGPLWSAVTTFQQKRWQWQSPIKCIPNTEKEKNCPKSLTFSYISLLPRAEHCSWQCPYQSTIKKQPQTSGPAFCVLVCYEHGRADVSWQPRTVHKQNEGLITKQQIKALPSVHYPLGKRDMAICWHSVFVMLLQEQTREQPRGLQTPKSSRWPCVAFVPKWLSVWTGQWQARQERTPNSLQ